MNRCEVSTGSTPAACGATRRAVLGGLDRPDPRFVARPMWEGSLDELDARFVGRLAVGWEVATSSTRGLWRDSPWGGRSRRARPAESGRHAVRAWEVSTRSTRGYDATRRVGPEGLDEFDPRD